MVCTFLLVRVLGLAAQRWICQVFVAKVLPYASANVINNPMQVMELILLIACTGLALGVPDGGSNVSEF